MKVSKETVLHGVRNFVAESEPGVLPVTSLNTCDASCFPVTTQACKRTLQITKFLHRGVLSKY
jgi:hypothetical protein